MKILRKINSLFFIDNETMVFNDLKSQIAIFKGKQFSEINSIDISQLRMNINQSKLNQEVIKNLIKIVDFIERK